MAKSAKNAANKLIQLDSILMPAEESIFGAAVVVAAVAFEAAAAVVVFEAAAAAVVVFPAGAAVVVFEAAAIIATYANIVITKSNLFMFNAVCKVLFNLCFDLVRLMQLFGARNSRQRRMCTQST